MIVPPSHEFYKESSRFEFSPMYARSISSVYNYL